MNIVVSNVKGGVGKTTTSVYLAAAAARRGRGPVLLVDADPQGSTAEWYEVDPLEGVDLIEGPSVRTVTKAMSREEGIVVVDTPPGEGNVVQAALGRADAVVIPTRAGGVEPNRVVTTLEMTPSNVPAGVVICSARLGTNDLEATVEWWTELKVPVWGIIPERVSIASGPSAPPFERRSGALRQSAEEGDRQEAVTSPVQRAGATCSSAWNWLSTQAMGAFPWSWPVSSERNQRRTATLDGDAGQRQEPPGQPELVGLVEQGVVELDGHDGGLRQVQRPVEELDLVVDGGLPEVVHARPQPVEAGADLGDQDAEPFRQMRVRPGELAVCSFIRRNSRNRASYSSLDFCSSATGIPRSRTETSCDSSRIGVEAGPCHAGQVEAEAAVGDAHGWDREIDRQLEPDDLAAVDRLHPPVRRQGVEQREAPTGGRFIAVLLDGREGGVAIGHVDPDTVRKGVQGDAHRCSPRAARRW